MATQWSSPFASSGDCDVLTTEDCSGSEEEEEQEENKKSADDFLPGMSAEFKKLWQATSEKHYDFAAWTKLIAYAESQKNVTACKKVYDAFLMLYPFSHIYWKKYADLLQHLGSAGDTEKVFERAVKSNQLNVTLWVSYVEFLMKTLDLTQKESNHKLQGVFKDAVKAAGLAFQSDDLWNMYIDFETQQGNLKMVAELYDRVLSIPTQQYQRHYEKYKIFACAHSPIQLLSTEEQEWIRSKIQLASDDDQIAAEDSEDNTDSLTESDLAQFREQMLKLREQLYLLNEAQVKQRCAFEERIKRRYFFAAPLNIKQLQNWRKYLAFEISHKQHDRIVTLYERCVMTCTLYEEFWLSYAQYMERHSVEAARTVFERACLICLPLKYSIHLQWAAFEEKHGCVESARTILSNLERVVPGLAIVRLKRVGLERRSGNMQEAEKLLNEALQISKGSKLASFYAIKLSRFLLKFQNDPQRAKAILTEALEREPDNISLHMHLLETEMSTDDNMDAPLITFEKALKCNLSNGVKRILSQRRLEYLEDFGSSSTASWKHAYAEHDALLKREAEGNKNKGNKKRFKIESVSEDCLPPGASSPPLCLFKTTVSQSSKSAPKTKTSADSTSTASVSVPTCSISTANSSVNSSATSTTVSYSSSSTHASPVSKPSPSNTGIRPSLRLFTPIQRTTGPLLSAQRPYLPPPRPYVPPPRPYVPPANVPMPFVGHYNAPRPPMPPPMPPPIPTMHQDFHANLFRGPPPTMDFTIPNQFGYGAWFQNFGQSWNRFFNPN
ncbi:pre-mRNA-processing factor 39-like [Hyperolius riggenbachi]|uniref:pre-mRNA-processing factor 39-like n=1 Tax=Hyperolius riggenbachi TaxID=752182 RepID=UPI0035A37D0D